MNLVNTNLVNFEIPIKILKDFDKGQIDKIYEQFYHLANHLAALDAQRDIPITAADLLAEKQKADYKPGSWANDSLKRITAYRKRRFQYHMEYMFRALELYASSKQSNKC